MIDYGVVRGVVRGVCIVLYIVVELAYTVASLLPGVVIMHCGV